MLPHDSARDRVDGQIGDASIERRRTASRPETNVRGISRDGFATKSPTFDTGTTVVGLALNDGVVLAADRRMSLGGQFTANKNVQKVEPVHETAAMAIAGSVGPAQSAVQSLRAAANLYRSRRGEPMSMQALSRTAGQILTGLPVAPLLGGVDEEGGHVFELDGAGSVVPDRYAAGGSGMALAYGVLEGRASAVETRDDARRAATAAIETASERDAGSGNGVTLATITPEGVSIESREAS